MGDGTASNGTRLLTRESIEQMQTPLLPATGLSSIGLSWWITPIKDAKLVGHGGGTNGQVSALRLVPASQFAMVVLTNCDMGGNVCNHTIDAALKQFLDLTIPSAEPLDLPQETLQEYTGKYDSAGATCSLTIQEGKLILEETIKGGFPTPESPPPPSPPPVRIALYAEDRFIVLDEPMKDARGEFLRNPDHSLAWLRFGGRIHAHLGTLETRNT